MDVDARQGITFLFNHELGHSIQHQRPDLYDEFQREILALAGDWSDYRKQLRTLGYVTESQINAEFVNDFMGSQMADLNSGVG